MIGSSIIVFREVLEAALIIAIVFGASRGIAHRTYWISGGVVAGVLGAGVIALFAGAISNAIEGTGQELFNAGVLLTAVAMLAWHNAWMAARGRALASELRQIGQDVKVGVRPLAALGVVVAIAVLREGAESVLFLYSLATSGAGWPSTLMGAFIGLASGAVLGWVVYRGLLIIPLKHFFDAVSWMVLLLASGLAATAAGYLNQAGVVPTLGRQVWDTSHILAQDSWLGMLLHILIGYVDRPMGIQILFYIVTLGTILALVYGIGQMSQRKHSAGMS